jgi:carboxyl-terminal processing protease
MFDLPNFRPPQGRTHKTAALTLMLAAALALAADPGTTLAASLRPCHTLLLDGKTASMEVTDSPSLHSLSNTMTIEVWFSANSFVGAEGGVNCLLRKNASAGKENFFLRFRSLDDGPVVEFSPGYGIGVLRAPFRFKLQTWYHLAATYDGTVARLFLNGVALGSNLLSGPIRIDSSELLVGRGDPNYSSGEFFDGAVADLRLWNKARSQAEISAAATVPLNGSEAGLVACWNFQDGTANDLLGPGRNGTLKGAARIVDSALPANLEPAAEAEPRTQRQELSVKERLEILEDLWKRLSAIYPALEYKGIYGREWTEPAAQRAREAKGDEEFYQVLRELMASLKDTHTHIASFPGQRRLASPPVVLNEIEGKVAVIRADAGTGLKPGDMLLTVDDRPVADCLAGQMKLVCGSTDRARVRGACGQLLAGVPGSTLTVGVQGPDNSLRRVTLRRERKAGFLEEPAITSRRLGDSVGYIRISRWGGDDLISQFDQALEEFKDCKGLVIDVRGNGGGSDELADEVNGRFIDKPVVSSIDFWREEGTQEFHKTIGWVQPRGPWTYRGRLCVLTDEGCASACEHFVSGIEAMGRALLVGAPTNGAGGGPTMVTLCDGTKLVISRAVGFRANGVMFEGHGIPPHILAIPSLEDLRQGRDAAVNIAQTWLLSAAPVPARSQPLSIP